MGLTLTGGRIAWSRKWQPTVVFLPGKFQGQRGLADYSWWSIKWDEIDVMRNKVSGCGFWQHGAFKKKKKRGDESEWCVKGRKDLWKLMAGYGTWKRGLARPRAGEGCVSSIHLMSELLGTVCTSQQGSPSTCRIHSGKTKIVPGFKPACSAQKQRECWKGCWYEGKRNVILQILF